MTKKSDNLPRLNLEVFKQEVNDLFSKIKRKDELRLLDCINHDGRVNSYDRPSLAGNGSCCGSGSLSNIRTDSTHSKLALLRLILYTRITNRGHLVYFNNTRYNATDQYLKKLGFEVKYFENPNHHHTIYRAEVFLDNLSIKQCQDMLAMKVAPPVAAKTTSLDTKMVARGVSGATTTKGQQLRDKYGRFVRKTKLQKL